VLLQEKKSVSAEEWEKAQPKPNPDFVEGGPAPAAAAAPGGK